jgi:hypothetical protein
VNGNGTLVQGKTRIYVRTAFFERNLFGVRNSVPKSCPVFVGSVCSGRGKEIFWVGINEITVQRVSSYCKGFLK